MESHLDLLGLEMSDAAARVQSQQSCCGWRRQCGGKPDPEADPDHDGGDTMDLNLSTTQRCEVLLKCARSVPRTSQLNCHETSFTSLTG